MGFRISSYPHGISMQWIRKKSIVIIMIIWMINRKVYGRIMANICSQYSWGEIQNVLLKDREKKRG